MSQQPGSLQQENLEQARKASGFELDQLLYHPSREVLEALMENPRMGEQQLLVLLSRKDLAREIIVKITQTRKWMDSYPVKLTIARHPRTPRYLALPLLKFVYVFDLLGLALSPGVKAELKRSAEDVILSQKEGLALGQRISLARRGSVRVAAALLSDPHPAVFESALANPYLTEQCVISALLADRDPPELPDGSPGKLPVGLAGAVIQHRRWGNQHGVKLALVRSKALSFARLLHILPELSLRELADVVTDRRVADDIRAYALAIVKTRKNHLSRRTQRPE